MYGVELSESQIIEIKKEQIKQLNTWLLKTGDNATKDAPLYNSANLNTYTRLVTRDEIESCCGGDISKPPMGPQDPEKGCAKIFRALDITIEDYKYIEEQTEKLNQKFINNEITEEELEKKLAELYIKKNHSTEVKNRLAWAMFDCKSQEEVSQMTSEEYQTYQEEWQKIRNMSANDFRELLKPENVDTKNAFEESSIMTVNQIVQYIDIVESVIGKDNWDNFDWQIDSNQFANIVEKVNGTDKDAELLEGKGRADIPENRQDLLRFLDEKGWLYEQFK